MTLPEADVSLLPHMSPVRQEFPRPQVTDIEQTVFAELSGVVPAGRIAAGARIGITAGSRGISNIAEIVRSAVLYFRKHGAEPFVIPAMGSHGGATPEGQKHLVEYYGVTEEAVGAPIRAGMETVHVGEGEHGVQAYLAKEAADSDGILLLNRIKPHTDYKGKIESGLTKICGIGLGKRDGAEEIHGNLFAIGLGASIRSAAEKIVAHGKILGGLGILENAYHETARLVGVPIENLFEREEALLVEARQLMPRLPLDDIHVLLCDQMGKNISGSGLDTNVIGRSVRGYLDTESWEEDMPVIRRIAVNDLTPESDGNATGVGFVDMITERFHQKIDLYPTAINTLTSCGPNGAKIPLAFRSTEQMLAWAIKSCGRDSNNPRVVYIRDTLNLSEILVSEACLPLLEGKKGVQVVGDLAPLEFDSEGYVRSPFVLHNP